MPVLSTGFVQFCAKDKENFYQVKDQVQVNILCQIPSTVLEFQSQLLPAEE